MGTTDDRGAVDGPAGPALGVFGVMNTDGEWNDSRETLFAGLVLESHKETGETAYLERGIAALKAGFVMM
jgi:hypothetical protein